MMPNPREATHPSIGLARLIHELKQISAQGDTGLRPALQDISERLAAEFERLTGESVTDRMIPSERRPGEVISVDQQSGILTGFTFAVRVMHNVGVGAEADRRLKKRVAEVADGECDLFLTDAQELANQEERQGRTFDEEDRKHFIKYWTETRRTLGFQDRAVARLVRQNYGPRPR
jgi:hypothetical protein